jgi:hypothetical protein
MKQKCGGTIHRFIIHLLVLKFKINVFLITCVALSPTTWWMSNNELTSKTKSKNIVESIMYSQISHISGV